MISLLEIPVLLLFVEELVYLAPANGALAHRVVFGNEDLLVECRGGLFAFYVNEILIRR